jgi:hypothetical protein
MQRHRCGRNFYCLKTASDGTIERSLFSEESLGSVRILHRAYSQCQISCLEPFGSSTVIGFNAFHKQAIQKESTVIGSKDPTCMSDGLEAGEMMRAKQGDPKKTHASACSADFLTLKIVSITDTWNGTATDASLASGHGNAQAQILFVTSAVHRVVPSKRCSTDH